MRQLSNKIYLSMRYVKKNPIMIVRRYCLYRNFRLHLYLCVVFVGLVFLFISHKKISSVENCNELPENSALRIACKELPENKSYNPVQELYNSESFKSNNSALDGGKRNTETGVMNKILNFKANANLLNFRSKLKMKIENSIHKSNEFENDLIESKYKKTTVSSQRTLVKHTLDAYTTNQIIENLKTKTKKVIDSGLELVNHPNIEQIKDYTHEPMKSTEVSSQIQVPLRNTFVTVPLFTTKMIPKLKEENKKHMLQNDEGNKPTTDISRKQLSLDEIKRKVLEINSAHTVYNADIFGPLSDDSIIILIQVHNRKDNLHELIKSLEKVRDIESALLVFSHDYYDEDILNLVLEIKFAKFLIIFFPYSIQLHPNEFPGLTPNDCPWNMDKNETEKIQCNMYQHPDSFGHYREGRVSQIKHHWWWKAVKIFDYHEYTKHHKGLFLFLEEDLYVTPDLIHVIKLMQYKKEEVCVNCSIFFLGFHSEKTVFLNWSPNQVEINNWNSIGFSFDRNLWGQIKDCLDVFCTFDDYNWDWSLRYTFQKCFKSMPSVLAIKGTRVFHTGECGVHHLEKTNCKIEDTMKNIHDFIDKINDKLFPKELEFVSGVFITPVVNKGWGGWADPRDQYLCIEMADHITQIK